MDSVLIGIAGLCLGVLLAHTRIPRIQLLPLVCLLILAGIGYATLMWAGGGSLLNGLLFVFAAILAACIYGAQLWKRRGLAEAFSTWQLIWMSALRPGYLRAASEQSTEVVEAESRES